MRLGEISKIRTGLALARKKASTQNSDYTYPSLTLKAIMDTGKIDTEALDDFNASETLNEEYLTKKGDVIIRLREPYLAASIDESNEGLLVSSLFAIMKPNNIIDSKFLACYINSSLAQKQFKKEANATNIPMMKLQDLAAMEVVLPSLEKQAKIVALLELAEQEITLLNELKSLKTIYKDELFSTIITKEQNV